MKINSGLLKTIVLLIGIIILLMVPFSVAMAASSPGETSALPPFDFTKFFEAAENNGTTVMAIVLGLVLVWGKLGVKGKIQFLSSLATGLVIGSLFMIAVLGLPTEFKGWFSVIMYGLMMGLVASGIYEVGKEVALKSAAKVLGLPSEKGKG